MFSRIIIIAIVLVCLAGVAFGALYIVSTQVTYTRHIDIPDRLKASTSTTLITTTTSVLLWGIVPVASSTSLFNGTIPSDWKVYEKPEWEYRIAYPQNLSDQVTRTGVTLSFPRTTYFHWPLQDEARMVISATTTCPTFDNESGSTSTVMINDTLFIRLESTDSGAGQITRKLLYMTATDAACYVFDFTIHGARGADLYVDQPDKIKQYDKVHIDDMAAVTRIFTTIVANFSLMPSDPGMSEDTVSPP